MASEVPGFKKAPLCILWGLLTLVLTQLHYFRTARVSFFERRSFITISNSNNQIIHSAKYGNIIYQFRLPQNQSHSYESVLFSLFSTSIFWCPVKTRSNNAYFSICKLLQCPKCWFNNVISIGSIGVGRESGDGTDPTASARAIRNDDHSWHCFSSNVGYKVSPRSIIAASDETPN